MNLPKNTKRKILNDVPLDMQIELYEALRQAAERNNETVNGFIKTAINERMERLGGLERALDGSSQK